jgi:NTE family protein
MKRIRAGFSLLFLCLFISGCSHWPVNPRMERYEPGVGYRYHLPAQPNNSEDTIFILAFSGGGTRAASLAYGVLEELARTPVKQKDQTRRLLDEVNIISAISGGSFTAAYYGLYGNRIFSEFEDKFLKKNIEAALYRKALNPVNWFRLASPTFSRSDLAAELYDEILFGGATFGDLAKRGGPFVVIHGTDLSTGARFTFTQEQFDLICSDLSKFPLSRAVATSSAYPPRLTPITLNNYAGSCSYREPPWIKTLDKAGNDGPRRAVLRLGELRSFEDSRNRPYIHLFDGAISDNLGVRGIIEVMDFLEADPETLRPFPPKGIRRIVVILVNAMHAPDREWDRKESPPGDAILSDQAMGIPIDRYSYETIETLKEKIKKWRRLMNGRGAQDGIIPRDSSSTLTDRSFHLIEIGFESIADEKERRYFMNLPTNFDLSSEAVDRLREIGARLLRGSPDYRNLLQELGAVPSS